MVAASLLSAAPASAGLKVIDLATGQRSTVVARDPENGWTSIRWTADGSALVGVANEELGLRLDVRRYPLDASKPKLLRRLPDAFDAVLNRDGTKVAALYDHGKGLRGGTGGVVIHDVASGRRSAKLPQSGIGDDLYESRLELAWSRDSARVIYHGWERRGRTVRIADANTGRVLRRLDGKRVYGVSPEAFSPTGDRVVYATGTNSRLYVLDLASGATRRLEATGFGHAWAPAGERIAVSTGDGVAVSGEDQRFGAAIPTEVPADTPQWAPDGSAIAYILRSQGPDRAAALALMVPGSEPRILVPPTKGGLFGLEWSPDGRRIAYVD